MEMSVTQCSCDDRKMYNKEILEYAENTEELLLLFQVEHPQRDLAWKNKFYKAVTGASFYNIGKSTGPDGRNYIAIGLAGDQKEAPHSYSEFNQYAFEEKAGLAIFNNKLDQTPSGILYYGSVWSFYEYEDVRGCINITDNYENAINVVATNPFFAIAIEKKDEVIMGTPNELFFPLYIQELITQEIKSILPSSDPIYKIVQEEKFILSHRIGIFLNTDYTLEQSAYLNKALAWYMPPYLPFYIN